MRSICRVVHNARGGIPCNLAWLPKRNSVLRYPASCSNTSFLFSSSTSSTSPTTSSSSSSSSSPSTETATNASGATTHFGFKTVVETEKAKMVEEVFRNVAHNYDIMNDMMSGGLHRLWKDEFVRMAGPILSSSSSTSTSTSSRTSRHHHQEQSTSMNDYEKRVTVLDVAGGTGDISFRIIDSMRRGFTRPAIRPKVIVCDINASMLAVGEERARNLGYVGSKSSSGSSSSNTSATTDNPEIEWMQGDAEVLERIPDNSVDLYTIAFGIRNVTHVDAALRTAYRVLKPGGRFMCLEFSRVTNPLLAKVYDAYSFAAIPAMGQAIAGDRASYQYLVESIRKFPDQDTFASMIEEAGFQNVSYTNFTLGVCAVHSGFKLKQTAATTTR